VTSALVFLLLLFAPPQPSSLQQVQAEPNPERRARFAIDYAVVAEKLAETAYSDGEMNQAAAMLKTAADAMSIAQESLAATGKKPGKSPAPYKYGEQRSRELLVRLGDLGRKMDAEERKMVEEPMARVQDIHDTWFEGIMGKSK
jgi:hypothetical protein